jgi:hypothetical protein
VVHCPTFIGCESKQQLHNLKTRHRRERFIKIDPLTLHTALRDESGFVLGDDPIGVLLVLEDTLEAMLTVNSCIKVCL